MSNHEPLRSYRAVAAGSNRAFGFTISAVMLILAVWPWLRHGQSPRAWALCASVAFSSLAFFAEHLLAPVNRLWFKLGLAMHAVVSPLVMGALFYGAVTPMGLIARALGKDILRLRRNDDLTYWIPRDPPGPAAGSMKNQF
jgi:hypothetical protein